VIPLWWDILKESKLSGKAKGSTLDASKIKINIKDDCKDKLKQYYDNAVRINGSNKRKDGLFNSQFVFNLGDMPEETACKIVDWVESLPLFPIRNEVLDFFEKKIDNYYVSVYLETLNRFVMHTLDEGKVEPIDIWELDLDIRLYWKSQQVFNIITRQEKNKPVESIDWRK
jgi:hypothetical protein